MINVIDAKSDPIRPSDTGLDVGSDGDGLPRVGAGGASAGSTHSEASASSACSTHFGGEEYLVDSNEILPSEGETERDLCDQ